MAAANSGSVGRGKPFGAGCVKPTIGVVLVTKPRMPAFTSERASVEKTRLRVASAIAVPE